MNKARRQAAIQARALASDGFSVLVPDLFGTGDSDGELRDARWETWLDDLERGANLAGTQAPGAIDRVGRAARNVAGRGTCSVRADPASVNSCYGSPSSAGACT